MCIHIIRDREVTARKAHACCWCAGGILPGETAQARTYTMHGDLISDYMHVECYEAMFEAADGDSCFEWMSGDYERGSIMPG